MAPHNWQQVADLFHRVRDLSTEERQRALDRARELDAEIVRDVESLLAAHARAGEFLESPALTEFDGDARLRPGAPLGDWRVLREIGRGGTSVVYLVEQERSEFVRFAAAKLLAPTIADADLEARFHSERRTLAQLEHPNIARLFDGGQTDGGRPYLVMEFVDGLPIDRFCEAEGLGLRERLELFRDVCATVHFAHQRLVIHRDLKPSNLLVARRADGLASVKLVDFGIAKWIEPEKPRSQDAPTQTRWLTPEYASPEQLRGQAVSTSTDIYSLGVVLYRLLTGLLPYDADPADALAFERAVRESTPVSLNERRARDEATTTRRLRRSATDDLDCILQHALAKEPERRYASADELASDIQRFLENRPVLARRDSAFYRFRRFARRHWASLSLAVAALAATLSAVIGIWWQSREVHAESNRLAQVNDFLLGLLEWPEPELSGRDFAYSSAVARVGGEIDARFGREPELAARLHARVGTTLHRLGEDQEARQHLDRASSFARDGASLAPAARADVELAHAEIDYDGGEFEQAELHALAALEASAGDAARSFDARNQLALAWLELDRVDQGRGLLDELASELDLARDDPRRVARTFGNLGLAEHRQGKLDEARDTIDRALEIARAALGENHVLVATLLELSSDVEQSDGVYAASFDKLKQVLAIRERALGPSRLEVAITLNAMARVAGLWLERRDEARGYLDRALAIVAERSKRGSDDWQIRYQSLDLRAQLLRADQHVAEALALWDEVLDGYRARLGENHAFVLAVRRSRARALRDLFCASDAAAELESVLDAYERQGRAERWPCGEIWGDLGAAQLAAGDDARALESYAKSIRLQSSAYDAEAWQLAVARLGRAEALLGLERTAEAEEDAQFAARVLEKSFGAQNPATALANSAFAACLGAKGERERAASLFKACIPLLRASKGDDHPWTRRVAARAVAFYRSIDDVADAQPLAAILDRH